MEKKWWQKVNNFNKIVDLLVEMFGLSQRTAEKQALALLQNNVSRETFEELSNTLEEITQFNSFNTFFDKTESNILIVVKDIHEAIKFKRIFPSENIFSLDVVNNREVSEFLNSGINEVIELIKNNSFNEVIFALGTDPQMKVIYEKLNSYVNELGMTTKFSKLATGIPIGANVKYIDEETIKGALEKREKIK